MAITLTGGRLGRRKLLGPVHGGTRPASARVRAAAFNVVGQNLDGLAILDLFAGVGLYGLESIARGADRVCFVERDRRAVDRLLRNLERLGASAEQGEVMSMPVERALVLLARAGRSFDLVFADPPYAADAAFRLLYDEHMASLTRPGAVLVLEHAARDQAPDNAPSAWELTRGRAYGQTALTIFRRIAQ